MKLFIYKIKKRLFLFLLLLLSSSATFSQQFSCGTTFDESRDFDFQDYANFIENYRHSATSRSDPEMDTVWIKLFMTGPEKLNRLDKAKILKGVAEINKLTKPANFMFYIKKNVSYMSDTPFSSVSNSFYRQLYNDEEAFEIYVFNELTGVEGFAFGTITNSDSFVALQRSYISTALIAHELGHLLDLIHTHGKYNSSSYGCVMHASPPLGMSADVYCKGAVRYDNRPDIDDNNDGISDCLQTGDDVCDTKAACLIRSCESICHSYGFDENKDAYNAAAGNFMSYAPSSCKYFFTDGQLARMRYTLDKYLAFNCREEKESLITVTSSEKKGTGTFHEAMTRIAHCERLNTINFDLSENDSIIYIEDLPVVWGGNITIDGLTKFGTKMILDGRNLHSGLDLHGENVTIKNLVIRSCFSAGLSIRAYEKCLIEDSDFKNNGYDGLYIFGSDNVVINNVSSIKNDSSGLYIAISRNIEINKSSLLRNGLSGIFLPISEHIRLNNLMTKDNGNIGVFTYNSADIQINELQSLNNLNKGLLLKFSNLIAINNSTFFNNANHGILIDSTNQVKLYGNKIFNNQKGLTIKDAQQVVVGLVCGEQNEFEENSISGVSLEGNTQATLNHNVWSCNVEGITIDATLKKEIVPPIIHPITDANVLSGTSEKGAIVTLYKSSSCSNVCEGEIFIKELASSGVWSYTLREPLEDGDKITAMSTMNGASSGFADCMILNCFNTNINCKPNSFSITNDVVFEVYPNPVTASLTVATKSSKNVILKVTLFNTQGISLSTFVCDSHDVTIPMRDYPEGVYFIQIDSEEGQFKHKVIKI